MKSHEMNMMNTQATCCIKCKFPFDYKDYCAAYTADDNNKLICIDCQNKELKKVKNESN